MRRLRGLHYHVEGIPNTVTTPIPPAPLINVLTPLRVELAPAFLPPDASEILVNDLAPMMRSRIAEEFGVQVPGIRFHEYEGACACAFRVVLNEVLVVETETAPPQLAANRDELREVLKALMEKVEEVVVDNLVLWIEVQEVENLLERHKNTDYARNVIGFETHHHIHPHSNLLSSLKRS